MGDGRAACQAVVKNVTDKNHILVMNMKTVLATTKYVASRGCAGSLY